MNNLTFELCLSAKMIDDYSKAELMQTEKQFTELIDDQKYSVHLRLIYKAMRTVVRKQIKLF